MAPLNTSRILIALCYKRMLMKRKRRQLRRNLLLLYLKRTTLVTNICFLSLLILTRGVAELARKPRVRSCRRLTRNTGWWENVWQNYSNSRFKLTFRVSRETFCFILDRIRPELERKTVVEEPISPECRLAICLYRLGRGDYPYTIAEMSGYGVSTIRQVVINVCEVIIKRLWKNSVSCHFPKTEDEFKEKMLDTEQLWQFPCCWAAIDGCHLPISCPPGREQAKKEYHNFKNFFSIVLMALVDAKYRFIWASAGFPGNSHDSVILQATDLWQRITNGEVIPPISKEIGQSNVPPLILGDSAFPFTMHLMKPYSRGIVNEKQRYYNYRLSRSRMVTECAYGQLKSRWRMLFKKCECSKETVKLFALACVILHNICIDKGDALSPQLDLTVDPTSHKQRPRDAIRTLLQMRNCAKVKNTNRIANAIRDNLVEFFWNERKNVK